MQEEPQEREVEGPDATSAAGTPDAARADDAPLVDDASGDEPGAAEVPPATDAPELAAREDAAPEPAEALEPPPPPPLSIAVDLDGRVHFALQQNDVPVLKRVRLANLGDEDLEDLELVVRAEPAFARPLTLRLDRLAAGTLHELERPPLELAPAWLEDVSERVRGELVFEVRHGDALWLAHVEPVEVFARDEWSGLGSLPQALAAFVQPNDPGVAEVLGEAARLLERWGVDPSLRGYQHADRAAVAQQAAAVYEALRARGLSYVSPPASFEQRGQRVRLPARVLAGGMGTCLDLALLLAAAWEQIGLHALVVLEQGHAYAGVWLDEASFPDPVEDVASRLAQRVELGELLCVEAVGLSSRPALDFEAAAREGKRRAVALERFVAALDVRRARLGGVRPLPAHGTWRDEVAGGARAAASAPDLAALGVDAAAAPTPTVETPASRLDRWRTKLLDLSLRNRLLSYRDTRTTLPLLVHDLAALEDALAEGRAFRLRARPPELGARDPRAALDDAARDAQRRELLDSELRSGRLCVDLEAPALERHLVELYRGARTEREEGGVSALFLAVGFLAWYEESGAASERLAPLLLLPLELTRSSVRAGFSLALADEEPRVNVTLLEKLRVDFGVDVPGLDPLPGGEEGVDVAAVLRAFRHAIRDQDRWSVREDAAVGLFSFSKFLMWSDLAQRAGELTAHPLVAHLVERPGDAYEPDARFPAAAELDAAHAPGETWCPLPADSSQLAAVWAASEGRSFVLEGPPGTGKSQTITNLIAHALASDKRVLFVSEKMAALDVVRARLEKLGLGEFCLELHSNKTSKRHVVEQLGAALEVRAGADAGAREATARELGRLREELDAYVRALHAPRASGETLWTGLAFLAGAPAAPARVALERDYDAAGLAAARASLEPLALADELSTPLAAHPWRAARLREVSPGDLAAIEDAVARVSEALAALRARAAAAAPTLGLDVVAASALQLEAVDALARELLAAPGLAAALLVRPDAAEAEAEARALIERVEDRAARRARVLARHEPALLELDLEGLRAAWIEAEARFWPLAWFGRRKVTKTLALVTKGGAAPAREEVAALLGEALELARVERDLRARRDEARALFGRLWRDGEPDARELADALAWALGLRELARRLAGARGAASLREAWAGLLAEERERLASGGDLARELEALRAALATERDARAALAQRLELDEARAFGEPDVPGALERRDAACAGWRGRTPSLREWCGWRRARRAAEEAGLEPLLRALEDGALPVADARAAFDHAWYARWCAEHFAGEPALKNFLRPEHERRVADFRALTARLAELTRDVLRARLAERVPPPGARDLDSSETGVLRRELRKKARHKPVRALLRELPNLVPRLKPVFLMSPLSVAQYLEPTHAPFDLVVFDEASQIPVWDAIGVLARARQAVIVGDPKQLPPTSFFQRGEDEDGPEPDDAVPEDLESILDEALASGLRTLTLDWHYRSRHESLIAFSNLRYYDGRLVTFPSPLLAREGVAWRPVPAGVYDRSGTRTNRAEAEAVVAEVVTRLKDPAHADRSLGVVTFNQAQQTLIEDLLEVARREDAALDAALASEAREALFVKNLENVQGDERDVILFSVTYGPDERGRVSLNFGPLNRDGGERRLNVAVTRARREVLVFSSLRPEHVDLARTTARGVADLKAFLEYADRGASALAGDNRLRPAAGAAHGLAARLAEALRARGYEVDEAVGASRFRVDLAVRDPRDAERYLVGLELDGPGYAASLTVRDRDASRPGVLAGLGWRLARLWSCDLYFDVEAEVARVLALVDAARAAREAEDAPGPSAAVEAPLAAAGDGADAAAALPEDAPRLASAPPPPPAPPAPEPYAPFDTSRPLGDADAFHEGRTNRSLRAAIKHVVAQEGPLSLDLLARRLAALWQLPSVRAKTLERVRELVPPEVVAREESGALFLWPADLDPAAWETYRPAREGDEPSERALDDVPLVELRNAALAQLRAHVALPREDLARETARVFGFARLGSAMRPRLDAALDLLVASGAARADGDAIELA